MFGDLVHCETLQELMYLCKRTNKIGIQKWFNCIENKSDIQNCNNYMDMKLLSHTTKRKKRDLHIVFIDLIKAYDKVLVDFLLEFLEARFVLIIYIMEMNDTYDGAKTQTRMVGVDCKHF
ncbi:hypothetical protein H5410_061560 [Solanum commersonii]|uniref:Reverse transcriptase domain-containing protein n=1 Tax=Solanum commersonii TaxID=4109 RepID=A0A9J5W8D1_SOLCO|nr:hypothetical protein H5410_061560 [Solanum commersonii]